MIAVDTPSGAVREVIIDHCFRAGLLLLGCGETAIRFCPPLCITSGQVTIALRILSTVLGELGKTPP